MNLEVITSTALDGVRHGFFTRKGGASSGIYTGLNCGGGSDDQEGAVEMNRARVAASMDALPEALVGVHQVHSPDVVVVTEPQNGTKPRADALVTRTPGLVLTVLAADCEPVLFADPEAGVIGAAHAGWRGALEGVLEATVDAMVAEGATRENIRAVVGPTISQANYEVGPEFMDRFMDDDPENGRFFAGGQGDRVQFDLPGFGVHRLREAGVGHAEWTRHCTYADPERFYSYRRSVHRKEADYGRLISAIRL
ncbi:peptidoglycan editing factor PgeF [Maritimibacter sp. UBA3975]|uniref:peptidoglycan editing factor PgeF n=1 Tax=Maritimibacter sp. UBA3975 TaxID=1946833 RepID=UPI000C0950D6|nr:peptidoglycan editing factor PgeF [Maritimibacter sp. UBA3975]MAM62526.1 polyphenol oxidase [Maritimibacter sp.]|tara:strand:- start:1943 stop:2701 length:759 start_codon:yes stop_codon:yes gene_type:complete